VRVTFFLWFSRVSGFPLDNCRDNSSPVNMAHISTFRSTVSARLPLRRIGLGGGGRGPSVCPSYPPWELLGELNHDAYR